MQKYIIQKMKMQQMIYKNSENGWEENIQDGTKVRKYLVEVPLIESGTSVMATYITNVPASLEYNQKASQDYVVTIKTH